MTCKISDQVMMCLALHLSVRRIAAGLGIDPSTVQRILSRLDRDLQEKRRLSTELQTYGVQLTEIEQKYVQMRNRDITTDDSR